MEKQYKTKQPYSIAVIDVGSPKQDNIGWYLIDGMGKRKDEQGKHLDGLIPLIVEQLKSGSVILGFEAPLYIPLRDELIDALKQRAADAGKKGTSSKPWSAGAGAQVLVMNLPIMVYVFERIKKSSMVVDICLDPEGFIASPGQLMIFEAFVSGEDKGEPTGDIHIHDARVLAKHCQRYSTACILPPAQAEPEQRFFNLAAAALLRCGLLDDVNLLSVSSPIYKPVVATD